MLDYRILLICLFTFDFNLAVLDVFERLEERLKFVLSGGKEWSFGCVFPEGSEIGGNYEFFVVQPIFKIGSLNLGCFKAAN